jgi:hypothetical protein
MINLKAHFNRFRLMADMAIANAVGGTISLATLDINSPTARSYARKL